MKHCLLYASALSLLFKLCSCSGQWECYNREPAYYGVCTNNGDTVMYLTQSIMGQNIEVKKYYENLGYTCIDTIAKYNYFPPFKKVLTTKQMQQLEELGYDCRSIGP